MSRGATIRVLATGLAAVVMASLASSTCGRSEVALTKATPLTLNDEFAFEDFTTEVRASASPSPSPTASATGTRSSASSSSRRTPAGTSPQAASSGGGRVSCPSGVVTGAYEEFSATENGKSRDDVPTWVVRVQGSIINQTARAVRNVRVAVTVHTDSAEADSESTTISQWVGVGSTHAWTVQLDEYESENKPDDKDLTFSVTGWSWGDDFAQCPTQGFTG